MVTNHVSKSWDDPPSRYFFFKLLLLIYPPSGFQWHMKVVGWDSRSQKISCHPGSGVNRKYVPCRHGTSCKTLRGVMGALFKKKNAKQEPKILPQHLGVPRNLVNAYFFFKVSLLIYPMYTLENSHFEPQKMELWFR